MLIQSSLRLLQSAVRYTVPTVLTLLLTANVAVAQAAGNSTQLDQMRRQIDALRRRTDSLQKRSDSLEKALIVSSTITSEIRPPTTRTSRSRR